MSQTPIFITGVYRSGTTLLTGLIGAHNDIDIGHPTVQYYRYILKKNIDPDKFKDIVQEISERIDFRYGIKLDTIRILKEIKAEALNKGQVDHKIIYDCVLEGFTGLAAKDGARRSY